MLPQLICFAAVLAATWFAFRWFRQEVARVEGQIQRAERILDWTRNGRRPHLQFDPATGHYHPLSL